MDAYKGLTGADKFSIAFRHTFSKGADYDSNNSATWRNGTWNIGDVKFEAESTLSTDKNVLANSFYIYPNPAKSIVNIESEASVNLKSVALYSILGQEVYRSANTKTIDIANFSKGLYLLKIESNDGAVATKKLVIE